MDKISLLRPSKNLESQAYEFRNEFFEHNVINGLWAFLSIFISIIVIFYNTTHNEMLKQ